MYIKNTISALAQRICLLIIVLTSGYSLHAQTNIGSTAPADSNAVLELTATNKGVLMPRISLSSTTSPAPLSAFVAGMQLYNTATVNDVLPGIYYSDGTKWVRILSVNPANGAWLKTGNSGTSPNNNYLGTSDSADFSMRTNAVERMRVMSNGNIGIGTNNPQAKLHVNGPVIISSLPMGADTDSLVSVDITTGKLRSIAPNRLIGVKKIIYTAAQGQQNFITPATITDPDKIFFYRNGVLINCTVAGANVVTAEIACESGDDVKIIQQQ